MKSMKSQKVYWMKTSTYVGIEPSKTNILDRNDTTNTFTPSPHLCDCIIEAACFLLYMYTETGFTLEFEATWEEKDVTWV